MERRLAAILAADVVGYSRLMSANEEGTLAALKAIRAEIIDPQMAQNQGRIVKLTGDGVLAEFPSVVKAVQCAAEIQRRLRQRREEQIQFRIGVNLGDVIVEGDDIYGDGVNVAARLESIAEPGGIAVSQSVCDHVGKRLPLTFEDRGEQQLKNIENPIRVYRVVPAEVRQSTSLDPISSKDLRPSIAILPFTNMSGDPEQEYFSDGITEDIITDLSKISGLFVVARQTAFTYKGRSVKVPQVSKELGVDYVLEGSVRKAGARVRVTGQLISGKDGGHVWAERFDRDLTDIFAIQDEITHAIVEQLRVKLLPQEKQAIGETPTQSIDAYNYYLKGRDFLRPGSKRYLHLAREMFTKAVEIDPEYARAYAGIAVCDSFLFMTYHVDISVERILQTAAKALELDDKLAEAHAARGVAFSAAERYDEANAEFNQALTFDPNSAETLYLYARSSVVQGKIEQATQLFERAAAADPNDYQSLCLLVGFYKKLGRIDEAKRCALLGVERAERALARDPQDSRPAQIGSGALLAVGDKQRARQWTERALLIDPDDLVAQYNAACSFSQLGDIELAVDWLERCLPKLGHEKIKWAKHDSDLDPLRDNERYQKLLQRLAPS